MLGLEQVAIDIEVEKEQALFRPWPERVAEKIVSVLPSGPAARSTLPALSMPAMEETLISNP